MSSGKNNILYPDNENGIYSYDYPEINGIKQYVQIRGTDRKNPVLLFIHGGPGSSVAGLCHIMQSEWERYFTVVNWDQRNTCKTYFANKDRADEIADTGTMDDFLNDVDGIIAYLHTVYDFEKIFIMGFSWGSAISAEYAKRHPENLLGCISAGQFINYREGVITVCRKMLKSAPQGSREAGRINELIDNFPQSPVWNSELMQHMRYYSVLTAKYIARHARRVPLSKILTSPFMNLKEKKAFVFNSYRLQKKAYETMLNYDFRRELNFRIPVLFIHGDEENICPPELLGECFDEINSPFKKKEIIPLASHCCFYDQSDVFLEKLISFTDEVLGKPSR